ncbi:MAG: radical SAM protein [Methanomicrobiales archaeon]|nr:radical SAM protein [Methanomicrobiales archaeon]
MTSDGVILDGYVDEPTCLGVPPYISPYVRYLSGVLKEHEIDPAYLTIDGLRQDPTRFQLLQEAKIVVVIAGTTVPGKYLGGTPAGLREIQQIGTALRKPVKVLGGPILYGYAGQGGKRAVHQAIGGYDVLLEGSPAASLDAYLSGKEPRAHLSYRDIDRWAKEGSTIIGEHPSFPHLMIELETASGCPRTLEGGCSFCTERFAGVPTYRSVEGIAGEVVSLYAQGARHFRLGKQPDLLVYGSSGGAYPCPRPELLETLFRSIRVAAPKLATLHIDNVNPATISRHEEAAREALESIVEGHTPGDVAAMGMETADPAVARANNLKAEPEEMATAIRVINEVGGERRQGVPELLPGLNFVLGLAGETPDTYRLNQVFLEEVFRSGMLVRRVNIRQVMPFEGTPAYSENTLGRYRKEFEIFKTWVRESFDLPMLRKVFPTGTVLERVVIEVSGDLSFGRQMGSYPILVGIPLSLREKTVHDVVVVNHGSRSVTALPLPIEVNRLPQQTLSWIPSVGKKRAAQILKNRPIGSLEEFRKIVGATPIDHFLSFILPAVPSL